MLTPPLLAYVKKSSFAVGLLWLIALGRLGFGEAIPAFPAAEGPGYLASGGRGGEVFVVTSLAADGPGTLADAVSQPNRIVVFDVSGIIDLHGKKLELTQPNITIAGQSAPGEGICLKHGTLRISASNIIVRHLRIRRGFIEEGNTGDSVEINPKDPGYVKPKFRGSDKDQAQEKLSAGEKLKPLHSIVLDHVSASWATDENLTMSGHIDRVHAQHCLIAEGLDYANPKQTPTQHAFGSLLGGAGSATIVGMHHCVYAHHRRRTPQCSAGDGSGNPPALVDFRNNTIYDSIEAFSHTGNHPIRMNFIANYYKPGPSTLPETRKYWFTLQKSQESILYAVGNFLVDQPHVHRDSWKGVLFEKGAKHTPSLAAKQPLEAPPISTEDAESAHRNVLLECGATLPSRDPVDSRIVEQIRNGSGRIIGRETDLPTNDRWPDYRSLPPLPDSDRDGLPDSWENAIGLNSKDRLDSSTLAPDGYAYIEHYLNNTVPTGHSTNGHPVVFVSAVDCRVTENKPGTIRIHHPGLTFEQVKYAVKPAGDNQALSIARIATDTPDVSILEVKLGSTFNTDRGDAMLIVELTPNENYLMGCPARALVATQARR
jgi:hypothetical protein